MPLSSWHFLVSWTLLDHIQQCAAQTYTYTETDSVTEGPFVNPGYLYDAEFTVYGNVKTIAVATHGNVAPSAPTIDVYQATLNSPVPGNSYTLQASLDAISTGTTAATQLGYAVEGGQSVKTSEIIVATTIHDSVAGMYADGTGAAYVFKQYSAATWTQTARLQPSDLTDGIADKFGASVAVDEFDPTRVMVGAPLAAADDSGAVYFYQGSPTAKYWTEGQKLMPDNPVANSRFGDEIELFGRFAAITQPETCEVFIFEQERPKPKAKPKESSPCDTSPTPAPVTSTWKPLVQHETLRWSQQQVLNFTNNPTYNCDVGRRTTTYPGTPDFEAGLNDHDPAGYGSDPAGGGYGGYLSLSMFEDTLAIGVPGYDEGERVRTDYMDSDPDPSLCHFTCTYYNPNPTPGNPAFCGSQTVDVSFNGPSNRLGCCPLAPSACPNSSPNLCGGTTTVPDFTGGPLHLGHCAEFPYAPGDNGIVYIYDMETFKGDCDRENYFPTVLSFDELVNLRDTDDNNDKDDDCHEEHHVHKPKPKPQCEVSRWSMQTSLTSPSPAMSNGRNSDCQNFGYKVDVYKDVITVNEVNTLSYDIGNPANPSPTGAYELFDTPITFEDEYHCMSNLYYPLYDEGFTSQPLVKDGFVYAYEKTSPNTWQHIGNAVAGYEINTNAVADIEAVNTQVVGTDIFTLESSSQTYSFDVQSTDQTWQCMVVTLMDQFGDGWGGAELQITDSDGRKQTFAPYCDSPGTTEPFVYTFRWCPDDWQDGDEVKMEILHSPSTKFRWELEWSVYFEWNQQVVYGDWETKMTLSYDTIGSQVLRLKHAEHLINTTAACVECDHYTAPPTGAPTSKPVRPKPKPKPTISPSPTPSKSSKSSKSLFTRDFEQDQDHQEGFWDEFESVDLLDNARDEEEWEAPRHSHLRNLHHKTAVRTHSPTMSPAPTLTLDEAFTTWEQIYLDGGDATGSRLGWDEAYNVDGYAIANIPMKYFISDKDGKHLYYEGTKCGTEAVYCWNDLPPGDRDYILRVGGAATLDDGTAETWKMCGQNGVKMQQLNFHVKDYITSNLNSDECDALMLVSRDTYCKNTLNLDVPVNGIIVLESLTLDSFSQNDLELLGHAISLIFSPTTLLEVVFQKHMHSSRGAHVGFTVEVPSSIFGLDATSFDTLNATGVDAIRLLKRADLSSSVDTLLLDYSALGLESNLHAHGKVYFEDLTIGDTVKATFVKNPYYYVDDDADLSEISLDGSQTAGDGDNSSVLEQIVNGIQNHPYSFLVLLMAVVVFVRRRSRGDEDDFDINAAAFSRHERKKSHAESLVKLPFSDKDRLGRTRESSSKKHRHESKDTSKKHKHRHSSEKKSHIERDTTSQPRVSASSTPTSIGTGELSSSSSDRDKYSQRFVPYGSAAELAEVEGWSTGRRAAGAAVTERRSQSQVSDLNALQPTSTHIPTEVEDEEYGDELDNILSHFESSTSSSDSSGDSDEWDHA